MQIENYYVSIIETAPTVSLAWKYVSFLFAGFSIEVEL